MKNFFCLFVFVLGVLSAHLAQAGEFKSTIADQRAVEVTVYNSNMGLVKDLRTVKMGEGSHYLSFMDVAQAINPVTVHIKSLSSPDQLAVLEQNYEYDLLNPQKLLEKFVGKNVKFLRINPYTDAKEIINAKVLSANNGAIFEIDGEIHVNQPGSIIYPEIPENFIAEPTLVWFLENRNPGEQEVEVSYITGAINWNADYTVVLNDENATGDLSGWVTIENKSGATYKNAKIKLVAGDVHRVEEKQVGDQRYFKSETEAFGIGRSGFAEESFFEYHLYTLDRPSTIKDNQTKQIELLSANDIPVKERLIYYGAREYYRSQMTGEMFSNQKIGAYVEIENKKENNLGMPLPKGVIRAYKKDKEGSLQLIGEDNIDHTPKDEKFKIKMGDAFDVVAERKQTDYKILSKNASQRFDVEMEWEIVLRNHKEKEATVEIIEPIWGDWEVINTTHPFEKIEAHTIKFTLKLQKDESQKITYRVKIRWW